ncbi:protein of unknown function [Kyrpidia spormannii]|uniref:Uncharacterized protein n=1 Tax=Kyrpidia spormannii TaxID=2055160 RepID=A0A6F9EHP3_9BACL|nr:protein of unknown function [Kyrpidia spormannii]
MGGLFQTTLIADCWHASKDLPSRAIFWAGIFFSATRSVPWRVGMSSTPESALCAANLRFSSSENGTTRSDSFADLGGDPALPWSGRRAPKAHEPTQALLPPYLRVTVSPLLVAAALSMKRVLVPRPPSRKRVRGLGLLHSKLR